MVLDVRFVLRFMESVSWRWSVFLGRLKLDCICGVEFNGAEYAFGLAQQSMMGSLKWQCSIWMHMVCEGWCAGVLFCTVWLRWERACGSWEA